MNGPYRAVLGYERICFFSPEPERILNFALRQNLPIWDIDRREGGVLFSVSRVYRRRFREFEGELKRGERLERTKGGSIRFLSRFGKRLGFFAGLLFFFFVLILSSRLVWSVQVKGNEHHTENEIRTLLREVGVRPGVWKKSIDTGEAALRFQVQNPDFSFTSVNLIGTVAYVEVRERETVEKTKTESIYSNLVSEIAGRIVRYEVLDGQIQVKVGESIPEGMLLISGVRENKSGGFTPVRARGRVFAETLRRFEVTIPFRQRESVYTGREKEAVSYEFLGVSIGRSKLENSPFSSFETIELSEDMSVFGREIPIVKNSLVFLETEEKNETLTVDRARILAYDKYEEYKRDIFASDDEILQESAFLSQDEKGVTLSVEILAVENICEEKPFFYNASYLVY